MNTPYIYLIENQLNGHKYIGKHSGTGRNYFGSGTALQNAVKKYGKSNFTKTILEYCDQDILSEREIFWIKEYNTYEGVGYNLTPGGEGWTVGMKHSNETIKKLNENPSQRGRTRSEEVKQKIANTLKQYYYSLTAEERSNIYGQGGRNQKGSKKKPFTPEHCKNISTALQGRKKAPRTKEHLEKIAQKKRTPVVMLDLSNKEIQTFNSLTEAAKYLKIPLASISCAVSGKQQTAGGFKWKKV